MAVLLIPVDYVGSYAVLVKRHSGFTPAVLVEFNENCDIVVKNDVIQQYRWGGEGAEQYFMPINRFEQRLRSKKTATQ